MAGLVAVLLLLASGYVWLIGAAAPRRTAAIGGPFSLVRDNGEAVTDQSFRGKYLLIYFGYASCRDICPTALSSVAAALDSLGAQAELVQPIFITVDPERDGPPVLQRFVSSFTPRLIGLTGTPGEIRKVAASYRVASVIHQPGAAALDYVVDHSSVLYLVGPDGRFIAPIRADATGAAIAKQVAGHLAPGSAAAHS